MVALSKSWLPVSSVHFHLDVHSETRLGAKGLLGPSADYSWNLSDFVIRKV